MLYVLPISSYCPWPLSDWLLLGLCPVCSDEHIIYTCCLCLVSNTVNVSFHIAGSGRERSDSVPSRTRTISDGPHPLPHLHTSRSLVPNSGNGRPHSVCWPAGSPVRWVPVPCNDAVTCWASRGGALCQHHCVLAVLHQVRAQLTHQARPYLLRRVREKDGEAMVTPWHQMNLWFLRKTAAMTSRGLDPHHSCCLSASYLLARYPLASVRAPPIR